MLALGTRVWETHQDALMSNLIHYTIFVLCLTPLLSSLRRSGVWVTKESWLAGS